KNDEAIVVYPLDRSTDHLLNRSVLAYRAALSHSDIISKRLTFPLPSCLSPPRLRPCVSASC
ncbi:hypothetical protein, partial [Dickeya sp. ws52]|uniref:hypothetical protein n=1 Tax=Dickeya sp. ws52 TaxID=2576377 RepID=UPI001F3691C1